MSIKHASIDDDPFVEKGEKRGDRGGKDVSWKVKNGRKKQGIEVVMDGEGGEEDDDADVDERAELALTKCGINSEGVMECSRN